jgi:hypothetical protein
VFLGKPPLLGGAIQAPFDHRLIVAGIPQDIEDQDANENSRQSWGRMTF